MNKIMEAKIIKKEEDLREILETGTFEMKTNSQEHKIERETLPISPTAKSGIDSDKTPDNLIQFEKYIKRTNFSHPYAKKNMLNKFREMFLEEEDE